jgi:hypothetical protein
MKQCRHTISVLILLAAGAACISLPRPAPADPLPQPQELAQAFESQIKPLVARYCHKCHSEDRLEAEIDLASFGTLADVRKGTPTWQKVAEMLESAQMPPRGALQPTAPERMRLQTWVQEYLAMEARARAGDPGRVVLRRLSNAEYTYTLRDITGVEGLAPAREFPVDGAAGEGFTNTGGALVISPALVTKYLDAAKEASGHAVLLPDGLRFSAYSTKSDWTNEILASIRALYARFADQGGGDRVNLQGIVFDTNQGGRLPVERYLAATLKFRQELSGGARSADDVARELSLSPKYLGLLWQTLNGQPVERPSLLLDDLRTQWRSAGPDDLPALAAAITRWQGALWRFASVGHIGKVNGPKAWMEPQNPVATRQELRAKLPESAEGNVVVLYLAASDAGDGASGDVVVFERPRLVAPGRPDLLLRNLRPVVGELASRRRKLFESAAGCLEAAAEASAASGSIDVAALAKKHNVDADALAAWLEYLGIGASGPAKLGELITRKAENMAGYTFIRGWVGDNALSVVANSSDQAVRIPGNMRPHSVAVHPAPTLSVVVGWRSAQAAAVKIAGTVQHAHPECGNGVAWSVELRRGNTRQRLATGVSQGARPVPFGPFEKIAVQAGDVVALIINPRDGNHSCDLTAVDLSLHDGKREWNLARDVAPDILSGNPHADGFGNDATWSFTSEPASGGSGHVIPAGSLLARWQAAADRQAQRALAAELQSLLVPGAAPPALPADQTLIVQLKSLGGPLLAAALRAVTANPSANRGGPQEEFGLDPALFGKAPMAAAGLPVDHADLCIQAPGIVEIKLPADLVAGSEFVTTGALHPKAGEEGSVQLALTHKRPVLASRLEPTAVAETLVNGAWTSNNRGVAFAAPVITREGSRARKRIERSFEDFRQIFPAALCYTKIVPVDEVVTLTLFHREDDQLCRLMLDEAQTRQLDRLWEELHYVSGDALTLVDAFAQLLEYATQDADPKVFEPLRKPIHDRAAAYRTWLVETQPAHVRAVCDFARRAYRRPLADAELQGLRSLYNALRSQEIPHEEAVRTLLARVLVAPAFLYKVEVPRPGSAQGPVSPFELASRLSYFLWSSAPDDQLWRAAETGRLGDSEALLKQARRMLRDGKVRRLATEFACQWLHVHGFDEFDEKSERHFPEFAGLRGALYEEAIQFFVDFFQNERPLRNLIDADYAFLNAELAALYGVPGVEGSHFRRVDGVKKYSRGGILTLGSTLAKQSGASRTSPILRGNWLSEVVLGERLPRPPKNVPRLEETPPAGLTERAMIERHSSDEACAKCHARIDPFGFALENFDAIGRYRQRDAQGFAIDPRTTLQDGTPVDGLEGLRVYLLTTRREAFARQFTRKLLGYALGRAVQLSDEPLLAELRGTLAQPDGHVGLVIEQIVNSRQFKEIRGRDTVDED